MQGGSSWNGIVILATPQPQKKELLVSAAAINPITVATDMPTNPPYNKTPCRSAYGTNPVASTILLPTQTIIVPICIQYINQLIAPIRLLPRPN